MDSPPQVVVKRRISTWIACVGLAALVVYVSFRKEGAPAPNAVARQDAAGADERARTEKRRACGVDAGATLREPDSIQGECQKAVLALLKSPEGAAFPGMFDADEALASPFGCATVYRSWVEARDSSGVERRQPYTCTYDPRTGIATVEWR